MLKCTLLAAALPAALLSLGPSPQDPAGQDPQPGSQVQVLRPAPAASAQASQGQRFDEPAWRLRLEEANLDVRLASFEELAPRLARDPVARRAVEGWAKAGGELAWTARLLLREARRHADPFEALRQRWRAPFQSLGSGPSSGLLPDLDALFEAPLDSSSGVRRQGSSVAISETPEGIRVEVTETVDGDESTQVYEAESREELLRLHPELESHLGAQASGRMLDLDSFFGDQGQGFGGLGLGFPGLGSSGWPSLLAPAQDRGTLGVFLTPASADGLTALTVESVQPRSLAEALGVRAGDELVELNGRRLNERSDIREVLEARQAGEAVRLLVIGSDGEARELEHTPR